MKGFHLRLRGASCLLYLVLPGGFRRGDNSFGFRGRVGALLFGVRLSGYDGFDGV
jgi:hypothetical protein